MTNPTGGLGKIARRLGAWLALLLLLQTAFSAYALADPAGRALQHATCFSQQIYGDGGGSAPVSPIHKPEKCCVAHVAAHALAPSPAHSQTVARRIALGAGGFPRDSAWPVRRLRNQSAFPRAPPVLFL